MIRDADELDLAVVRRVADWQHARSLLLTRWHVAEHVGCTRLEATRYLELLRRTESHRWRWHGRTLAPLHGVPA